jgi:hypothetical protein
MRLTAEVLVVGGGIAGTVAGIAAGRAGADTLLVERWGFLGGAGSAEEIVARLVTLGASDGHYRFTMSTGHTMDRVSYDPELLKVVLDGLATEACVKLLSHAALLDVTRSGQAITEVQLLSKIGPVAYVPDTGGRAPACRSSRCPTAAGTYCCRTRYATRCRWPSSASPPPCRWSAKGGCTPWPLSVAIGWRCCRRRRRWPRRASRASRSMAEQALFATRSVPAAGVKRLAALLPEALADPVIASRIRDLGLLPATRDRAAFAAAFRQEYHQWGEVVPARGIRAE